MDEARDFPAGAGAPAKPEEPAWGIPVWARIFYGIGGAAIPLLCFWMGFLEAPNKPDWQSGRFVDYLKFMLGGPCTHVFYPFLAWSVLSLSATAIRPRLAPGSWLIRWGIYSGVVPCLQYSIIMFLVLREDWLGKGLEQIATTAYVIMPLPALAGVYAARRHETGDGRGWGLANRVEGIAILALVGPLLALVYVSNFHSIKSDPAELLIHGFILALMTGPSWALMAYGFLSIRLLRAGACRAPSKRARIGVPAAWFGGYGAAFWLSVERAIDQYRRLPMEPSRCYVSTAAARGHRALVGSRPVTLGGRTVRVNRQMRVFKGAEIALEAFCPRLHRLLRGLYDGIGPCLASTLVVPLLADTAYLALKPAEWVCRAALGGLRREALDRLYAP